MPIVLVCGGRDFNDWNFFRDKLLDILDDKYWLDENMMPVDVTIVTGGAKGADDLGASFAQVFWTGYREYKADWNTHGKAAGPIRNQQMLDEEPDIVLVVAFPGGSGTADMVRRAKKKGIEVKEVKHA